MDEEKLIEIQVKKSQKKNFKKVSTKRWKYYHIEHNRSYPVYESL
jgi:hypothetical protein